MAQTNKCYSAGVHPYKRLFCVKTVTNWSSLHADAVNEEQPFKVDATLHSFLN